MIGAMLSVSEPLIRWNWIGDHLGAIRHALFQHLVLTFVAVGVGLAISALLAAIAVRFRVTYQPINAVTGIMYAIPSLALFILLTPITGLTELTSAWPIGSLLSAGMAAVPRKAPARHRRTASTRRLGIRVEPQPGVPSRDPERAQASDLI